MNVAKRTTAAGPRPGRFRLILPRLLVVMAAMAMLGAVAQGQPPSEPSTSPQPAGPAPDSRAGQTEAQAALDAETEANGNDANSEAKDADAPIVEEEINILRLLEAGGRLMLPILAMSLLVVTFAVERFLGLRRRKVLPPELTEGLGKLAGKQGGFNPRRAYKLCQEYPSAAANVIKAMLLKIGRPHAELEHAVSEANNREAARLFANVRWLSLAAGVTPLLGLLGTVWGMIQAFFVTANLPTGANKAEYLADGIYVALVTTFAGLAVAIPAAVLSHWYEGRIQKLFRELDETLMGLMPQLERFEGRMRVSRDPAELPGDGKPPAAGKAPRGASR